MTFFRTINDSFINIKSFFLKRNLFFFIYSFQKKTTAFVFEMLPSLTR